MATRTYFAFFGQLSVSTGEAHSLTGRFSTYGQLLAFSTKAERDTYVADHPRDDNHNEAVACNKTTARKYFLGMSVADYEEMIDDAVSAIDL